jgi:hypothetical protein
MAGTGDESWDEGLSGTDFDAEQDAAPKFAAKLRPTGQKVNIDDLRKKLSDPGFTKELCIAFIKTLPEKKRPGTSHAGAWQEKPESEWVTTAMPLYTNAQAYVLRLVERAFLHDTLDSSAFDANTNEIVKRLRQSAAFWEGRSDAGVDTSLIDQFVQSISDAVKSQISAARGEAAPAAPLAGADPRKAALVGLEKSIAVIAKNLQNTDSSPATTGRVTIYENPEGAGGIAGVNMVIPHQLAAIVKEELGTLGIGYKEQAEKALDVYGSSLLTGGADRVRFTIDSSAISNEQLMKLKHNLEDRMKISPLSQPALAAA